jgi:predicted transcriptional regulator of viral defense system
MDAQVRTRALDRATAQLAEGQHGVVARAQLFRLGLGRGAIGRRVERGRLHPLYRGVYAVGHRILSTEARWMAAVLAGGAGAVLSHRSAAALWGIRPSSRARIDLTVPRKLHSRDGMEFHYATLPPDEVTRERGIPVTTVTRTIFDLASVRERRDVERAMTEAEVKGLTDLLSLSDLLARYPRRCGTKTIRTILLDQDIGTTRTRNDLEEGFLAFVDRMGLPRPRMNEWLHVGGRWIEADCVWHEQRLIVELDGRATHGTAEAFESDRARDRAVTVAGWRVIRITWRQLRDDPEALAADLRALLARS